MKRKPRVLLADGNALFRVGLRLLLETRDDLRVVGELPSGRVDATRIRRRDWDLLLIDSGAELGRLGVLRRAAGRRRIVALSDDPAPDYALAALDAGADAFVSKRQPPTALLSALLTFEKCR